ncbi:MAG: hypothetical protein CCU26_16370 [Nitrospira sp. UW-LDO-01]|nr:MAG: hypothetical protein CCU26_16370 [Nitrospira sp. UW-LDO-01]
MNLHLGGWPKPVSSPCYADTRNPLSPSSQRMQASSSGTSCFPPFVLSDHPERQIMGLGPLAVAPEHQRSGIGSALVRAGLEQCKHLSFEAVVVLGNPAYYRRFGFTPCGSSHTVMRRPVRVSRLDWPDRSSLKS